MTSEEVHRLSRRIDRINRLMRRNMNKIRAERLAQMWIRAVDKMLDYKRARLVSK